MRIIETAAGMPWASSRRFGVDLRAASAVLALSPVAMAMDEHADATVMTGLGPAGEAGRIVQAVEGFAVTFPDDWTVHEPEPGLLHSLAPTSVPRDLAGYDVLLIAYSDERREACTVRDGTRARQADPGWTSLKDAVAGDLEAYRLDPTTVDTDSGYIELPAGQAAFSGHLVEHGFYSRTYYLVSADAWFVLGCGARDRPEDRWLSIAETFEFLPVTAGPVVIGGRIELLDPGFAVEVPDGWIAADLTHPDLIQLLESMPTTGSWLGAALEGSLGVLFDDRLAIGHDMVLWTSLAKEGPRNRQHCEAWVQDSTMTSIRELVEVNAEHFEDDPTQTWARIDLPAGEAARNDFEWSPTSFGSEFIFLDGHRLITLGCVQGIPVEGVDDAARRNAWLSIAETFEFLPAEDQPNRHE
jgi:hypothetical protein